MILPKELKGLKYQVLLVGYQALSFIVFLHLVRTKIRGIINAIKGVVAMATTNVSFRMDTEDKIEAEKLVKSFGISLNGLFNIVVKQMIKEQSIPFTVSIKTQEEMELELFLAKGNGLRESSKGILEEHFAMFPDNEFLDEEEIDWGAPVGDEVW